MIDRIKSLFSGKNSLGGAAVILIATTLLSNVFGLVRDRFFAQKIPTDLLDTYFAAFRIPDLIFNLLILGTVSAAFIPIFLEYRQKSEKDAWRIAGISLNLAIISLLVISVILYFVMPYITPLMVPEFSAQKQELTTSLAQILLIQPFFLGLSYLFSGILNALKRFFVYSLAPLVYTAAIVASTVWFADTYSVYALVWGVVVGAFLHMLIQFVVARAIGFRWILDFNFNHKAMKKLIRLMIPRSIGLGALQLTLLVFTAIASTLGPGSVAVYNFADNIQTMPTAVFGLAFITALYPTLSERAAAKELDQFAHLLWRGIRYLLFILIPAGLGLILLRAEIVRVILGSGHFGWEATVATANTLGFFALSLFAQAIAALLARSFYALQDTKTPTIYNLISYAISIILAFWLGKALLVPGLALAFSIGSFVNMALLYITLRNRFPSVKQKETEIWQLAGKLVIASLVLIIVTQGAKTIVGNVVDMTRTLGVLAKLMAGVVGGGASYLAVAYLLRIEEFKILGWLLIAKFFPGKFNRQIPFMETEQ